MSDDDLRAKLTAVLVGNGCGPGDGIHSWRCEHPELHVCHCVPDMVEDLAAVVREHLAQACDKGIGGAYASAMRQGHFPYGLVMDASNPWREVQP